MIIAKIFFWILGFMFFAGAIGSAIVVIFTTIEDIEELRESEEPPKTFASPVAPGTGDSH